MARTRRSQRTPLRSPHSSSEFTLRETPLSPPSTELSLFLPRPLSYLRSPIIELSIGAGDDMTTLFAHQALLARSPFLVDALAAFDPDVPAVRRIEFESEDVQTMGSFLEYLYTGEYFPKKTGDGLEGAAESMAAAAAEDDGERLLQHARVYTLAEKLGVGELKALAHSKVHRINSSAKGEIAYARFVYANTPRDDNTIRKPIASFWGQRSHVLRHEAEEDFKQLCLDYPDFGFDVLSYVLDARERRGGREREEEVTKSGRKRARMA